MAQLLAYIFDETAVLAWEHQWRKSTKCNKRPRDKLFFNKLQTVKINFLCINRTFKRVKVKMQKLGEGALGK
jgi:hypothetical protein